LETLDWDKTVPGPKLQEIIDNTTPTPTVSALATIVHGFSHGISSADKRKLQTIKFKG